MSILCNYPLRSYEQLDSSPSLGRKGLLDSRAFLNITAFGFVQNDSAMKSFHSLDLGLGGPLSAHPPSSTPPSSTPPSSTPPSAGLLHTPYRLADHPILFTRVLQYKHKKARDSFHTRLRLTHCFYLLLQLIRKYLYYFSQLMSAFAFTSLGLS
jgi:hypothetical protein